jgi:hypothetical protein
MALKPVVAIVIPIYRPELSTEEAYSLRHLAAHLGPYPKYLVAPESLGARLEGATTLSFPDHFFAGIAGYNRLMFSPAFYRAFRAYRYILIYQLDALVLSDRLLEFCHQDWDYIGAPWFESDPQLGFWGSGNGGFSLRRVASFLGVLESDSFKRASLWSLLRRSWHYPFPDLEREVRTQAWLKKVNSLRHMLRYREKYIEHYRWNEDLFWAYRATWIHPQFKVAPPNASLDFAFECFPAYCYAQNAERLPFGVHAWARYERNFWEPHLLEAGPLPALTFAKQAEAG